MIRPVRFVPVFVRFVFVCWMRVPATSDCDLRLRAAELITNRDNLPVACDLRPVPYDCDRVLRLCVPYRFARNRA